MGYPKLGFGSLLRGPVLALVGALLLAFVGLAGTLVGRPASAQGSGGKTVLLLNEGAVVCSEEVATVLMTDLAYARTFAEIEYGRYRRRSSYVRPEHVTAVVSVSECPEGAIVVSPDGY